MKKKADNRIISRMAGTEGYQELERIRKQNGGKLLPDIVVREAAEENSPLHDFFEWDDSAAASEYRQEQARMLIRSVVVYSEALGTDYRFYASVVVGEDEGPSYIPLKMALSRKDTREQVIRDAIGDLQSVKKKYDNIERLKSALGDLVEDLANDIGR